MFAAVARIHWELKRVRSMCQRVNVNRVTDDGLSVYERLVTFEGQEHCSMQGDDMVLFCPVSPLRITSQHSLECMEVFVCKLHRFGLR